jgi:hypothetical protein
MRGARSRTRSHCAARCTGPRTPRGGGNRARSREVDSGSGMRRAGHWASCSRPTQSSEAAARGKPTLTCDATCGGGAARGSGVAPASDAGTPSGTSRGIAGGSGTGAARGCARAASARRAVRSGARGATSYWKEKRNGRNEPSPQARAMLACHCVCSRRFQILPPDNSALSARGRTVPATERCCRRWRGST